MNCRKLSENYLWLDGIEQGLDEKHSKMMHRVRGKEEESDKGVIRE